jgi:hypothetical protein
MAMYCDMTPESRNSSLLGNGSVNIFSRKRTHATIEEAVLSVGADPRLYNEDLRQLRTMARKESHCAVTVRLLRICRRDTTSED